jgi:hypothetical protein
MKNPFSIGILFMFATNFFLILIFLCFHKNWSLNNILANIPNLIEWILYIILVVAPIFFFFIYFKPLINSFDKLQSEKSANKPPADKSATEENG